jgi:hypothetical protein
VVDGPRSRDGAGGSGDGSSFGSCRRISRSSSWSRLLGSSPSSSRKSRRVSAYTTASRRGDCRRRRCHVVPLIAPFQLSPDARASLWKQGVGEAAARSEVVAGCGASDRPPDQPASAQSERGKHVLATGAPHLGCGSGSVVRLSLGKAPDPHVIRAHWKPRPWSWDGLARLAASQKW